MFFTLQFYFARWTSLCDAVIAKSSRVKCYNDVTYTLSMKLREQQLIAWTAQSLPNPTRAQSLLATIVFIKSRSLLKAPLHILKMKSKSWKSKEESKEKEEEFDL